MLKRRIYWPIYNHFISHKFDAIFLVRYLQSLLSNAQHNKINEISWQQLIEEQFHIMDHFICGHITAWIPKTSFKWIFIVEGFSLIEHFTPCHFLAVRACHIVNWNVDWSKRKAKIHNNTHQLKCHRFSFAKVFTYFCLVVAIL